jgi:hypothetical protein
MAVVLAFARYDAASGVPDISMLLILMLPMLLKLLARWGF